MGVRISNRYQGTHTRETYLPADLKNETFESQELFRRAEVNIQRRNFDKAKELLGEALKISPDNPFYLSYYGLCAGMIGDLTEGAELCRKAEKLLPVSPIILVNHGRILLEQGLRKEARKQFSRAYELDNTNSAAALELSGMGVRRQPVIPFLPRNNLFNKVFGKFRHRLFGYKKLGWKKL